VTPTGSGQAGAGCRTALFDRVESPGKLERFADGEGARIPPPPMFSAKSSESLENKRVDILESAKEFVRV